jgi:T3SS negative regulator,GrlR
MVGAHIDCIIIHIIKGKETMEGFWLVEFKGVKGFGGGAVTLIHGKVFGGDSGFMYSGTYNEQGNTMTAKIHVKRAFPGTASVMGQENSIWSLQEHSKEM